jgi:hypothetical protein
MSIFGIGHSLFVVTLKFSKQCSLKVENSGENSNDNEVYAMNV